MEEMIAYCGITCTECPAYLATQNDDDEERKRVAETWSKQYQADIKIEDIVCDGCLLGHTRYFSHCSVCEIRTCATGKGMQNCAYCDDFACETLTSFFQLVPEAKATLEAIRGGQ